MSYDRWDDDFYDPSWSDAEAEEQLAAWREENLPPQRVYYNQETGDFACRCRAYQRDGKCPHIYRYRDQVTVSLSREWQDCF